MELYVEHLLLRDNHQRFAKSITVSYGENMRLDQGMTVVIHKMPQNRFSTKLYEVIRTIAKSSKIKTVSVIGPHIQAGLNGTCA